MTFSLSTSEPRLRDGTDELSPHGDINWKRDTLEPIPDVEREIPNRGDSYISVATSDAIVADGDWFILLNHYIDIDSSSLRASKLDSVWSWLFRNVSAADWLASQSSLRYWFSKSSENRKSKRIVKEIESLFALATFIEFESGMTNYFSDSLEEVIEKYGEPALREVQKLILGEATPFTIAGEALRYIGNTESNVFVEARRKMLEACLLRSRFMLVRDGAAAGLSYLGDRKSIPCLERAIEQELHVELRNDLVDVLKLLQDT